MEAVFLSGEGQFDFHPQWRWKSFYCFPVVRVKGKPKEYFFTSSDFFANKFILLCSFHSSISDSGNNTKLDLFFFDIFVDILNQGPKLKIFILLFSSVFVLLGF